MFSIRRVLAAVAVSGAAVVMVAGGANASTGVTGAHSTKSVLCNGREAHVYAPTMKAVNRTSGVDRQIVAFQPVLYEWNGTTWASYSTYGPAKYGTATDTASPTVWRDLGTNANPGGGDFTMLLTDNGYYRVAYKMWWATGSSWTGSDYLWASGYYSLSQVGAVNPLNWCKV